MYYTEPAKVGGGTVNLKTNDALWVRCPICNGKTRTERKDSDSQRTFLKKQNDSPVL